MAVDKKPDPHNMDVGAGKLVCYVCSEDLSARQDVDQGEGEKKAKKKKKGDQLIKPGLVELKCDGTGFAGGGDNMVKKEGTAFQC